MRQARVRGGLSLLIFFILAFPIAGQIGTYKVISPGEQYVVYAADPVLGQEIARLAEKIRSDLFSTLGWASFSQFQTEIWIAPQEPSADFPPASSSLDLVDGAWKKKITTYLQPGLKEEILPREIINLILAEMGNEKILFQAKKKTVASPPLWLVEGLRRKLTAVEIGEMAAARTISLQDYSDLDRLFQAHNFSRDEAANQRFAFAAERFVSFLMAQSGGKQRLKSFIKKFADPKEEKKLKQEVALAWREEIRHNQILATMDALDVE